MGWVKAKFRQAMGTKKESDGIALRNDRLRSEGRQEKRLGHQEEAELRESARRRKKDR
ncbi:hypothetical protein ACWF94_30820 [Streptomyces sp. NPDC055078]